MRHNLLVRKSIILAFLLLAVIFGVARAQFTSVSGGPICITTVSCSPLSIALGDTAIIDAQSIVGSERGMFVTCRDDAMVVSTQTSHDIIFSCVPPTPTPTATATPTSTPTITPSPTATATQEVSATMALSDNLVAYWSLADLTDASGGGNTLTNNNAATFTTGKVGNAVDLEGSSSQYLSIASNASLQTGDIDFTITAWVKLESIGNNDILGKWRVSDSSREYVLLYSTTANAFRFAVSDDGTSIAVVDATSFGSASIDTWYFVVCWHDASANQIAISVNGTGNSQSHSTGVNSDTSDFSIGFRIGSGTPWDGLIDEVGFWKRVLTTDERNALYNSGSGRDYAYISGGAAASDNRAQFVEIGRPFGNIVQRTGGARMIILN